MNNNERSIWENVKSIITGVADAANHTTSMVSKFAESGEELGEATLVLSKSNTKVITIETGAKEAEKLENLRDKYGEDVFNTVSAKVS